MARYTGPAESAHPRGRDMVLSTGYSHRGEASAPRDDGVTSAYVGGFNPSASATLNAQFWFERFPWRPTAAWSAIAGLLALGYGASLADVWGSIDWRTLALVLLLADPLWGSIWRLASGRDELLPLRRQVMAQQFWLPYLTADSPAAHVMGRSGASASTVFPLVFRVALPTVLLACAVALVLGLSALWMTGAVVLCGVLGWMNRRLWRRQTHLLHAAVTVALPWGLALSQLGAVPRSVEVAWAWQWALLGLWTVHNWGEGRCLRASTDRWGWGLMAAAEIGIILLLVLARAPVLLAILVILGIPTWLSIYYGRPLQRVTFWWLISMLISALAVGQTMLVS